jgi:hypothetical protein
MSRAVIDTPQALDAAIEANRHARRDKLVRAMRNQRFRTRIPLGLSGCVTLFALLPYFLAGDKEAAAILPITASVTFATTYSAGKYGQTRAVERLSALNRSM